MYIGHKPLAFPLGDVVSLVFSLGGFCSAVHIHWGLLSGRAYPQELLLSSLAYPLGAFVSPAFRLGGAFTGLAFYMGCFCSALHIHWGEGVSNPCIATGWFLTVLAFPLEGFNHQPAFSLWIFVNPCIFRLGTFVW